MKLLRYIFPVGDENKKMSALLLASRVIFGLLLARHGLEKLMNFGTLSAQFPDPLGVGGDVSLALGIFGELVCSLAFVLGLLSRLAVIPMMFTMLVAFVTVHGGSIADGELAFLYLVVFALLFIAGPGRYSADSWIGRKFIG
jgi:putative oxidoreductase